MYEIRKRKANWIGHILRRNCLVQKVIVPKFYAPVFVFLWDVAATQKRIIFLLYRLCKYRN